MPDWLTSNGIDVPYATPSGDAGLRLKNDLLALALRSGGILAPCRVVATSNISLSTLQTIDGVTVSAGDRILLTNQSPASQNGVWVAATGSWTRPADYASGAVFTSGGIHVTVVEGTVYALTEWTIGAAYAQLTVDTSTPAVAAAANFPQGLTLPNIGGNVGVTNDGSGGLNFAANQITFTNSGFGTVNFYGGGAITGDGSGGVSFNGTAATIDVSGNFNGAGAYFGSGFGGFGMGMSGQQANSVGPATALRTFGLIASGGSGFYPDFSLTDLLVVSGAYGSTAQYVDQGNVTTGETNLNQYGYEFFPTLGGVLAANGNTLEIEYELVLAATAATKRIRLYFGSTGSPSTDTLIYDSTAIAVTANGVVNLCLRVIRADATHIRCSITAVLSGTGISVTSTTTYIALTPTFSLANFITLTGTSSANTNDIVAKFMKAEVIP
jgi:hypothetical protein